MFSNSQAAESIAVTAERYAAYSRSNVCDLISEQDDMLSEGNREHYFSVGRSAIDAIARAMIAAGASKIGRILDLPCGYGRVARHLKAFFPEAELFVGEIDEDKERYCRETFGAHILSAPRDFISSPLLKFDLIWSGSLLTHFDADAFERALRWYVSALSAGGIAIITTHGRKHICQTPFKRLAPLRWDKMETDYLVKGFGFSPDEGSGIGMSISAPSWIMQLVERWPFVRIVSFQEAGWVDDQDVLVVRAV